MDFVINNNELEEYRGDDEHVRIPDGVTRIATFAFCDCKSIERVIVPSSVKEIESCAFQNCTNLSSVVLSQGLESIARMAFRHCESLQSISIPNSVETLYDSVFQGCKSLERVDLGEGLESIGDDCFVNCDSLEQVTIPQSVEYISPHAFGYRMTEKPHRQGATLDTYWYDKSYTKNDRFVIKGPRNSEAERYATKNGFDFVSQTDGKAEECEPPQEKSHRFAAPTGRNERKKEKAFSVEFYVLGGTMYREDQIDPDKLHGVYDCFFMTDEQFVEIPQCVTKIAKEAFCVFPRLKSITIPSSVTAIGPCAFQHCRELKEITIPASVTEIGYGAFSDCGDILIRGKKGSYAERYAKGCGLTFAAEIGADDEEEEAPQPEKRSFRSFFHRNKK